MLFAMICGSSWGKAETLPDAEAVESVGDITDSIIEGVPSQQLYNESYVSRQNPPGETMDEQPTLLMTGHVDLLNDDSENAISLELESAVMDESAHPSVPRTIVAQLEPHTETTQNASEMNSMPGSSVPVIDYPVETAMTERDAPPAKFQDVLRFSGMGSTETEQFTGEAFFDKTTATVGETVTATWVISGGTPPYKVNSYYWVVTEEGSETRIYEESGSDLAVDALSFAPTKGNKLRLELNLQDSENRVLSFVIPWIAVTGATTVSPLTGEAHFDKTTVAVGETVTASWTLSGGTPPYKINSYFWVVTEEGSETQIYEKSGSDLTVESLSFAPAKGNKLQLELNLQDSENRPLSFILPWIPIEEEPMAEPLPGGEADAAETLEIIITFDKASVAIGEPIKASWVITGGEMPYRSVSCSWTVFTGDTGYGTQGVEAGNTSSYTPVYGDSVSIDVFVTDAAGRMKGVGSELISIQPSANFGDANDSGEVELMDLVAIIDHLVFGKPVVSPANADANGRDGIDLMDLVWIIDFLIGR